MKTRFHLWAVAFLMLVMASNALAQHEMFIPRPTSVTFLNSIIMGDTLADGKRKDTLRVYVLQRGGNWFFNGIIKNAGWPLTIKAQDSVGAKPIVYGYVQPTATTVPLNFIDGGGDIYLKNIVVSGVFDLDTAYRNFSYGAPRELVVYNTPGNFSMRVDSCIFAYGAQANLRTFAAIRSIVVTNCILGNNGQMALQNIGNGRALDIRNVQIDTVRMANNTIVNGYDRVIRHLASVGRLGNLIFEHNTIYNMGGMYGMMSLGKLGQNDGKAAGRVIIKNNLWVDAHVLGADTNSNKQFDYRENGEPWSSTITDKVNMVGIYHQFEGDTTVQSTFTIQNNYRQFSPAITGVWNTAKTSGWQPSLKEASPLSNYIWKKIGADSVNAFKTMAAITFTKAPKTMEDFVTWYHSPLALGGSGGASSGGTNVRDYDRHVVRYYRDTLNMTYSTSNAAYTGGTDGLPAGDLNWFPDKLKLYTGVSKNNSSSPAEFALEQNYPNPFNPSTQISYTLTNSNMVSLKVFNLIGQEVATLVNGVEGIGRHSVTFDASKLSTGVYFYTLRAGNNVVTKKMMLMK